MKTRFFVFLLIGLMTISCKNDKVIHQEDIVMDEENYMKYTHEDFSIYYPNSWIIEKNPQPEVAFYLFLENEMDGFLENINLMVVPNVGNMNLEEFTQTSIKEYEENQGKIISSERIKTPTKEYQKIVVSSKMNELDLKFIQHYYHTQSKIYLLTFTAQEKDFAKYEDEAELVMKSFTLE